MTRTKLLALAIAGWLASSAPTHAAFIFSDVEVTSNSVTFTIDGDMTGYVGSSSYLDQFSIVYVGDLWTGATAFSSNTWSSSVFDNESILINGNTGGFNSFYDYSWSMYGGNDL